MLNVTNCSQQSAASKSMKHMKYINSLPGKTPMIKVSVCKPRCPSSVSFVVTRKKKSTKRAKHVKEIKMHKNHRDHQTKEVRLSIAHVPILINYFYMFASFHQVFIFVNKQTCLCFVGLKSFSPPSPCEKR